MKHPSLVYLVLCLWCWAPLAQLRAVPLSVFLGGSPPSAPAFTAHTAGFDGNDVIKRTSPPTGLSDGSAFTISLFLDPTGLDSTLQNILWFSSSRLEIRKTTGNAYQVVALSSAGSSLLTATSSVTKTASDGWFHLYICVDLTTSANCKFYFDGTVDASASWSVTNGTIDLLTSAPNYKLGGGNSDLNKAHTSMAEFWFNDSYLDSPSSFATGAVPKSLGSDGSGPGVAPVWYLSLAGSGASWIGDSSANANSFDTIFGTLGSPAAP